MIVGTMAIRTPVPVIIMRMTMMVIMVVRSPRPAQNRKSLPPLAGKQVEPGPAIGAKLPVSKSAVSVIAMLVMSRRAAINPTMPTATSACTNADRKAITTPRRTRCSFATR